LRIRASSSARTTLTAGSVKRDYIDPPSVERQVPPNHASAPLVARESGDHVRSFGPERRARSCCSSSAGSGSPCAPNDTSARVATRESDDTPRQRRKEGSAPAARLPLKEQCGARRARISSSSSR
jgi:hypothetical protein